MDDNNQAPTHVQKVWKVVKWPLVVAIVVIVGLITYWAFWPYRAPADMGFIYYDPDLAIVRHRTLWDWLGLLIIPLALAIGAYWLNRSQKETELKIAEKAREKDREIAEKARVVDRETAEKTRTVERDIADSTQKQATLVTYFDRMTELLLEHGLRESAPDSEVRSIARARTITVVRSLDSERNQQLFGFLKASRLIDKGFPIIVLVGSDFSRANLSGVDLSGADLSGAILEEADLSGAMLKRTNLSGANLFEANLFKANLNEANLTKAYLDKANLRGANLSDSDLSQARFEEAALNGADLFGANLKDAYLHKALLRYAELHVSILHETIFFDANLENANVSDADFRGAILEGANLIDLKDWTMEQFDQSMSLENATMPDGTLLGTENREGPTYDEWRAQYLAKQKK